MAEMKRKQIVEDLRNLSDQELVDALANERKKLYDLRTQNIIKQVENTAAAPHSRKQIARILTLQKERSMASEV